MAEKKYKCPFAVYDKRFRFLMCRETFKGDEKIADAKQAVEHICVYTKYCTCVNRPINDAGAEKCYESRLKKV